MSFHFYNMLTIFKKIYILPVVLNKRIHEMIKKIPTYENILKEIYEYMIHYTKMPMIEWITKKHR